MNCMQFSETDQQVKLEFKDVSYFSSGEGGTTDHSNLINRDAADQHPMSAITGLVDALGGKQPMGNYVTEESDPTVPEWAKQPNKPAYTAQEVGALPDTTHIPSTADDVNAEPSGAVSQHNVSDAAHSDIRLLIQGLSDRLIAVADSDDTTLDQLSEIVAYIKSNRDLISAITTSKVNVADIVDNLTTNASNKPLSAAQGVALKALIDAITVPDKLPNPNALTFTGAVEATYDGSEAVSVEIPNGGGGSAGTSGQWEYIGEFTEANQPTFESGKYRFFYAEAFFTADATSGSVYRYPCIDGYMYCRWALANVTSQKMRMFIARGLCALFYATSGTTYPGATDRGNVSLHPAGTQAASVGTAFLTTSDAANYPISTFGIKLWGAK